MNLVEHFSIYLFPMVLLLIIFINNIMKLRRTSDSRLFDVLTIIDFVLMLTDIISNALKERQNDGIIQWIVMLDIFCMLLMLFTAAIWSAYVCCRLYRSSDRRHTYILVGSSMGVCSVTAVCVAAVWVRHFLVMGLEDIYTLILKCYVGLSILAVCMMMGSCILAVWFYLHEKIKENRQECMHLAAFSLIPIAGIILQSMNMSCKLAAPGIALAILYIYVNMQNKKVITDSLTGVNNRRELEAYIDRRSRQISQSDWGILMIDVDGFKQINDIFGHRIGDEALWDVADILKRALGKENVFIARYGGDEFSICGDWKDGESIARLAKLLEDEVIRFNNKSKRAYKLSLSIGGAMWSESGRDKENMIKLADSRMYEMKRRKSGKEQEE